MTQNGNGVAGVLKTIPGTVWVFLLTQAVAIVIFAVRLDNRVTSLEKRVAVHEAKLDVYGEAMKHGSQVIIRNEERLTNLIDRVVRLQTDIDILIKNR